MITEVRSDRAKKGRPALLAAYAAVTKAGTLPRDSVVRVMTDLGVTQLTARDLLRRAVDAGELLISSRDDKGRPTFVMPL